MTARRVLGLVVAMMLVSGCATVPMRPAGPVELESARAAFERIRARATSFRTVRGVLELVWRADDGSATESCRASLSCAPPDSLWIRGTSAAFFTVFDLAADARRVRIDIPREGVAVFGLREDAAWSALPLSAHELLVALLADPCPGSACGDSVGWDPIVPHRMRSPGWRLDLHPDSGLPAHWMRLDESGREIRWEEWVIRDGHPWPLVMELRDGARAERLEVRVGRLDFDRPIPASRFSLDISSGREIITPGEAKARWERRGGRLLLQE